MTIMPIPALEDLKVTINESILVFPSQQTEKKFLFLSNIDQILNYNIPTLHFFSANPDFPPQIVSKRLKMALEKVLVPYDFMAGRLCLNQQSGRNEIHCNAAGAGFVVASSDLSLNQVGDFVYPNPGFRQLAPQTLDNMASQPLCIFQVTSFKCGGLAIGMSMNHVLFDGTGAQTFIENLATQAFDDKPLNVIPNHNRRLLAARSPPQVVFPHPEFFKPELPNISGPPVFDCEREELEFRIFKLSSSDVNYLKDKAKQGSATKTNLKITSFNVVAALIWRCKALSSCPDNNKADRVSTLLNVVDLRSRLDPPLPPSYCGNAVLCAYASAKCIDLENEPFSKLVEMVSEGPTRVTNEYAKSAIDWLEIHKGLPSGEYMVSSWLRLRFAKVVYPWGNPVYSGPVVSHRKDICWIFSDPEDGVNALVSLPPHEMDKFKSYFRNSIHSMII